MPSSVPLPRNRYRSRAMASIVPNTVETMVAKKATMRELRRAPITRSSWNISPYQRSDGWVQIPTLSLSLKEKTIRRTIGA